MENKLWRMCDSSGLYTDKLKTTAAQCKPLSLLTSLFPSLPHSCSVALWPLETNWNRIATVINQAATLPQTAHEINSRRGKFRRRKASWDEALVSSRVFRLVRKSCPIRHTHTAYAREADLGESVKLSVIRALCLGQHLPVKVFIPNVGWKRQRIPPSQPGLRRTICATFSVNKNVKLISSA